MSILFAKDHKISRSNLLVISGNLGNYYVTSHYSEASAVGISMITEGLTSLTTITPEESNKEIQKFNNSTIIVKYKRRHVNSRQDKENS